MAGTLTATTIQNDTSSPPTFRNNSVEIGRLCRAFVNWAGASGTINSSFNVSSVTRNSTGNYRVNFTTAMPNANYAVCPSTRTGAYTSNNSVILLGCETGSDLTTTYVNLYNANASGTYFDAGLMTVAIFS